MSKKRKVIQIIAIILFCIFLTLFLVTMLYYGGLLAFIFMSYISTLLIYYIVLDKKSKNKRSSKVKKINFHK